MTIAKTSRAAAALAMLAMAMPVCALTLAGDTDRDGAVDLTKDAEGRAEWTAARGAIFLNNNDRDTTGTMPDNADAVVNGPKDLEDLAAVKASPLPDLKEPVTVTVDAASAPYVRVFAKVGESYTAVDLGKPGNVPADAAKAGLELRVEGLRYAQPAWSGYTTITLKAGEASDSAKLRVAPFVMLPNSQRGDVLYVREHIGRNEAFVKALKEIVPAAGAKLFVIPGGDSPYKSNAIWLQDAMEVGYTQMPGKWMNVVLPSNRNNSLDNFPKDGLLGPDYGWFQQGQYRKLYGEGDGGNSWLDWFGNLEVSPPVKGYPAGRVYYGGDGFTNPEAALDPAITSMLAAQEIQGPPVRFDTGWLVIRHVDEMICFIPSGNAERPWKVLVPDAALTFYLLKEWKEGGLADTPLLEIYFPGLTVAKLADDAALEAYNTKVQKERIEPNIELLKKEFDVREEEIIRVPYLMATSGEVMLPDMVNAVVLNGHLLMSDPNGPKKDGQDLFQEHMKSQLTGTGLTPHFLDDRQYHKWSGNTHCGTNVRRQPFDKAWWELLKEKKAGS